ncbi:putative MFS family arabinose efflux permease [Nitrobacteraceae bacterium AZCC 2161]
MIAADLAITTASVGLIITLTQIGYAVGLIFIVPLGDILDRRKLILCQTLLSSAALAGVAVARTEEWLLIAMVLVGVLAVVVQVLVVFSASLAAPAARGKAVGTVTSGIVVGILLARFVAGVLADFGGWRAIYAASAAVTLAMAGLLYRSLPQDDGARTSIRYVALLRSVAFLYAEMPLLRWRGALGFLVFATLGTFWTSLVLPLSAAPYLYSHIEIGLMGLAGAGGALAASGAGRDRGFAQSTTGVALVLLVASWGFIALLHSSLAALVVGVVLLDLAIQAVHVTNQNMIFAARPDARGRLVGAYMLFYSTGSAAGAAGSTAIYAQAGWSGVCVLGAAFSSTARVVWAAAQLRQRKGM